MGERPCRHALPVPPGRDGYAGMRRGIDGPLASQQGFAVRYEHGRILHEWALAMQGHVDEGVAQVRLGLAARQRIGPRLGRPYRLSLLAEAYSQTGQLEAGLRVLAEVLAPVATAQEAWWAAKAHWLKRTPLLHLVSADGPRAEDCFQ
jgi:predicted ATPase